MDLRYFDDSEYEQRRQKVRDSMSRRGLDACLITSPENIYYLIGLDHMGYFAYQLLVLPAKGTPALITRAMEKATVRDQVPDIIHVGYTDGSKPIQTPVGVEPAEQDLELIGDQTTRDLRKRPSLIASAAVDKTVETLYDMGVANGVLGLDMNSTFLSYAMAEGIMDSTPDANWEDTGNLIDNVRLVQSPAELELTRKAATISDSMMLSAIAAAGEGINEQEIMAAIYDAMFRRGGTYPGFVPLVRSSSDLEHEHGTWSSHQLENDDLLFLEMAGCARRYHAPIGRLVFIDKIPEDAQRMNEICQQAMYAAAAEMKPGAIAGDVYEHWQQVLNQNGLNEYHRHHCGYSVGIGYPPSWSGSGVPVGLRPQSDMVLREGMVFHLMSWLLRSGSGDAFLSDTVVITSSGCEFLTSVRRDVYVR
ncbi:MAG: Xaa-Pro dipeptidase [Halioglobus sp.]|jgi:Xaa-Pro dipeptidase